MKNKAWVFGTFLCALLCLQLSGCSEPTVGQQFRDIMAEIDAKCRKEGLGPYLSPGEPPRSKKRTDGSCAILKIKPADPLATEEGRFAYSIKLPPPHDKPKVEYKKGMGAEAYFEELCEKEEGDFVFRTVEGVEGIKIMRPISKPTGLYLWEEATGPTVGSFVSPVNGIYVFVDAVEFANETSGATHLVRYSVDPNWQSNARLYAPSYGRVRSIVDESTARYGYTFRNSPLEDRENGIVGKELIVLDIETNEVLALRRRFSRLRFMEKNTLQPMASTPCRLIPTESADNRFIARILVPVVRTEGDKK